jgi:hypothetical protein
MSSPDTIVGAVLDSSGTCPLSSDLCYHHPDCSGWCDSTTPPYSPPAIAGGALSLPPSTEGGNIRWVVCISLVTRINSGAVLILVGAPDCSGCALIGAQHSWHLRVSSRIPKLRDGIHSCRSGYLLS